MTKKMSMIDRTILPSQIPKPKKKTRGLITSKPGYAWFFEHTVVYGPGSLRESFTSVRSLFGEKSKKRILSKHGGFLGVVKGRIPVDPHYVLYEYHTHTEAFKKRKKIRDFMKKHGITKQEMRSKYGKRKLRSGRVGLGIIEKQANLKELLK